MKIMTEGHEYRNLLESLCLLYFQGESFRPDDPGERMVVSRLGYDGEGRFCHTEITDGDERAEAVSRNDGDDGKELVARSFYEAGERLTGIRPAWGTLTGIRPVKRVIEMLSSGMDEDGIKEALWARNLVSPEKAELAIATAKTERKAVSMIPPGSVSIYVSIPFCPTRCAYCSFVSQSVAKSAKLIPGYLDMLEREVAGWGALVRELGLTVSTVYVGGGTPTTLDENGLARLTEVLFREFDLSEVSEFSVEAGRPDTVTAGKLKILKEAGIGRISINTQTLDDEVLLAIGRHHSAAEFEKAMDLAKEFGFDVINTDLIAGLPGESVDGFLGGLERVIGYGVENITVHTLSLKKSSDYSENRREMFGGRSETVRLMLDGASKRLVAAGFAPYYLYRQKNTVGNYENVGYSKAGNECLYNIYIMGEYQTILSAGAGGVTKLVDLGSGRIERAFNYKYPAEYIADPAKWESGIELSRKFLMNWM